MPLLSALPLGEQALMRSYYRYVEPIQIAWRKRSRMVRFGIESLDKIACGEIDLASSSPHCVPVCAEIVEAHRVYLAKYLFCDGRTISRFDGSKTTLQLTNYQRAAFELSARQKFLARIVEPDMFFLLLILGTLGLYAEFTHPGAIIPGVVGAICSVLALYAMHLLPVNIAGVLLILTAVTLFVLEAKYTSHGVLLLGGVIAMIFGAIFLIRSPLTTGGVSLGMAVAVTLPFAALSVFLMRLVLRSRKWKPATGREELLGARGVAASGLKSGVEGMIRIHGETWRAVSGADVPAGAAVKVLRVEGLKLQVEPVGAEGSQIP